MAIYVITFVGVFILMILTVGGSNLQDSSKWWIILSSSFISTGVVYFLRHKTIKEGDQNELERLYKKLEMQAEELETKFDERDLSPKITSQIIPENVPDELRDAVDLAILEVLVDEQFFYLPEIDFEKRLIFTEILRYKKILLEKEKIFADFDSFVKNELTSEIRRMFSPFLRPVRFLTSSDEPIPFTTSFLGNINPLSPAIETLVKISQEFYSERSDHEREKLDPLFFLKYQIDKNFQEAEEVYPSDRKNINLSKDTLIEKYLDLTPFPHFLDKELPFSLPYEKRFEHVHVLAGTGHGKTQLLQSLIFNDIARAYDGDCGVCLIDSQGDLFNLFKKLPWFSPNPQFSSKHPLSERLILIDPEDTEYPVCLNMFDIPLKGTQLQNEMLLNSTTSLYQYIFSELVEGKLTMYQENVFQNCTRLLLTIPGADISHFFDLLNYPDKYRHYFKNLDSTTREFFEKEFKSDIYKGTKEQIRARLRRVLTNTTFRRMFVNRENKVDMLEAMNQGKIVLINTSKMLLQTDGAKMLGKFFIVLILQSVFQRAHLPENQRKPFFVYIDEAQDYLNEALTTFFEQARKYNTGLIIAHQYIKQLDSISTALRHSVLANTSIKLIGNTTPDDARVMAERLKCTTDEILSLRKKDRKESEFLCFIKDVTLGGAVKIKVPLGAVNQKGQMTENEYSSLLASIRQKYCTTAEERKRQRPQPEEKPAKRSGTKKFKRPQKEKQQVPAPPEPNFNDIGGIEDL